MRLIDADQMAVDESAAYISAQVQIDDELTRKLNEVVHMKVQRLIADTPTVDAVSVVRCEFCYHHRTYKGRDMCARNAILLDGQEVGLRATLKDNFCSYGSRKREL